MKVIALAMGLAFAATATGTVAAQPSSCGPQTVVREGDTLSEIARRCDVSEGAILAGNGRIDSSADLIVGETIDLAAQDRGTLDRLRAIAGEATEDLADTAREAGSTISRSVDGFLAENPGIDRRLRELTGTADGSPTTLTVETSDTSSGRTARLEGSGLPPDEPVIITAGPAGMAQTRLADARTDADGRLSVDVPLAGATDLDDRRLTVRSRDGTWKATTSAGR